MVTKALKVLAAIAIVGAVTLAAWGIGQLVRTEGCPSGQVRGVVDEDEEGNVIYGCVPE